MHPRRCRLVLLLLLALPTLLLGSGCVRKDLHIAALDALAEAQRDGGELSTALTSCESSLDEGSVKLERCAARKSAMAAARDEVLADNTALRAQLNAMGADLGKLSTEASTLSSMLEESQSALATARDRQAAAEARDAIYRQLKERLRSMIESDKLSVRIVRGRMVIDLKQDILFPSARAKLSPLGEETLAKVAQALADFPDRSFQIEGHTDNVPMKSDRFPSNWELSTARAVAVVKLFIKRGMGADNLSAAGYGEHQPRADNASPEGQALNRRIEIIMLPDLQTLPDLMDSL
jgi:chemotaxis protein MotB